MDGDDHLSIDASLAPKDYGRQPTKSSKMKAKRGEDHQRGLNTHVWKRVGADKVTYPDAESIEEPKRDREVVRRVEDEKVKRRAEVPREKGMKCVRSEMSRVVKKREPKHRLSSPLRNGSSISTSSCDSLSSLLGHSLTMTSSSGISPNLTGITSTSPTDCPSPNPSVISLDPFGKEKKCNCSHKPTTKIAQALSIDTPVSTDTVDQSMKTTTTKPLSSPSNDSLLSQSSNDVPPFTDLCASEYDSDVESSPPYDPPCVSRRSTPYASCDDGSRMEDASWYTVDQSNNRSIEKRESARKKRESRKMRAMRRPMDIRTTGPAPQEDAIDPAKAWAVLIMMAIAVLVYRYHLPLCHGKRHHHH